MENKDSFVFYESFLEMAQDLPTDKDKVLFYESIMKFALYGELPEYERLKEVIKWRKEE